jgi:hypothetical protein
MIGAKPSADSVVAESSETTTREPWQVRILEEKTELSDKIGKLAAFMAGELFPSLDEAEQNRLSRQLMAMKSYRSILRERIQAWDPPVASPEVTVEILEAETGLPE